MKWKSLRTMSGINQVTLSPESIGWRGDRFHRSAFLLDGYHLFSQLEKAGNRSILEEHFLARIVVRKRDSDDMIS
jgi:hypothetical protein